MNETEVQANVGMPADGTTAGALLRQAREAAGLHIAALAVALKVPVKKLEALEANQLDQLPDAVFVRALASSVCRTLKVDPTSVLALLPQTAAPRLTPGYSGINEPFRAPSDGARPSWKSQLTRPVVLVVVVLLLGALGLMVLPMPERHEASSDVPKPVSTTLQQQTLASPAQLVTSPPVSVLPAQQPLATGAPTVRDATTSLAGASQISANPALVVAVPSTAPVTSTLTRSTTAVESGVSSRSTASTAPLAGATLATGLVVFKVVGESWVEVVDAKGIIALRRVLGPGETVGASGTPPLNVVIGRANETEVQVRGKRFDLAPVSRDNVARFEVK